MCSSKTLVKSLGKAVEEDYQSQNLTQNPHHCSQRVLEEGEVAAAGVTEILVAVVELLVEEVVAVYAPDNAPPVGHNSAANDLLGWHNDHLWGQQGLGEGEGEHSNPHHHTHLFFSSSS